MSISPSKQSDLEDSSVREKAQPSIVRNENVLTDIEDSQGDDYEFTSSRQTKRESSAFNKFKGKSSGVRLLLKHLGKQNRKIHPENSTISPQLVVRNGRFEIFEPEKVMRRQRTTLSKHITEEKKTANGYYGCFNLLKWKVDMLQFKYGDIVPFFRKQIKKVEDVCQQRTRESRSNISTDFAEWRKF